MTITIDMKYKKIWLVFYLACFFFVLFFFELPEGIKVFILSDRKHTYDHMKKVADSQ